MRNVTFAATQYACSWDKRANVAKAKDLVRQAASKGANAILIQELFETPYFCQDQSPDYFALAQPFEGNPLIAEMADLAKELGVGARSSARWARQSAGISGFPKARAAWR
jgi:N-carbamoylputrescine amidase